MKAYFVSGMGANEKAFERLQFPDSVEKVFIPWLLPQKAESFSSYVSRMAEAIDESEPFLLVGLSFGGIVVQEIHQLKKAKKLILISTVKSDAEKPFFMQFAKKTLAHKLIPTQFFASDKLVSYTFFRKLYNSKLPDIKEVFQFREPQYLNWAIHQVVIWNPSYTIPEKEYVHIHGDKDPVFPSEKIENAVKIRNGNHIMIMQKYKKISELIQKELEEVLPQVSYSE